MNTKHVERLTCFIKQLGIIDTVYVDVLALVQVQELIWTTCHGNFDNMAMINSKKSNLNKTKLTKSQILESLLISVSTELIKDVIVAFVRGLEHNT